MFKIPKLGKWSNTHLKTRCNKFPKEQEYYESDIGWNKYKLWKKAQKIGKNQSGDATSKYPVNPKSASLGWTSQIFEGRGLLERYGHILKAR